MSRRRRWTMVGGVVALFAVILLILGVRLTGTSTQVAPELTKRAAVEVTPVARGPIAEFVSAVGTVQALSDVKVSSETAGRVTGVLVDVGHKVRKGQVLVRVDDELKEVALDQAKAQVLAAETNLGKTRKDYERTETLYKSGDVADIELEGYRLAYRSAEAQYQSAVAGLRLAQRQLEDTRIKAPVNGHVASRHIEPGEMVGPGSEIMNIVDISSAKVRLSVPEEDIGKLVLGQQAIIRMDTRPGETIEGRVFTIGSKAETPTGHSFPVEVLVENAAARGLKVGMFARVEVQAASVKDALVISKESLVDDDREPAVFVAENGFAKLRKITLGVRGDGYYQVLRGLREGDLVISFGQKALKEGSAVQYK